MTDRSIARFQFSTEDALSFVLKFTGISLAGRTLRVKVKDRASSTTRATLTIGAGLTVTGTDQVSAAVATADMVTWPRGEYSADLVDITGAPSTIMAVRFVYDLPGSLVYGASDRVAYVTWGDNKAYVTATGAVGPAGPAGPQGEGWSPVFAVANDGARRVQRVVDWTGGAGDKPATGLYVGATGLVAAIADAVDIRGPQGLKGDKGDIGDIGLQGDKGWSPATAIVSDGVRRVLQVVDWVGGAGTKPGTGYVGATGLVPSIADGIDIRGPQGPAGSVVDGDKGDITVSGSGTAWTIDARTVDFAKTIAVATSRLLGRKTSGSGDIEVLSPSDARAILQITAQGETLLLATDAATQRSALGANANGGDIFTGATAAGKAMAVAADAAAQKTLLATGMELISAGSITSSTAYAEITLPTGFKSFRIVARNHRPAVDGGYLSLQFKKAGSWKTASGDYYWSQVYWSSSGQGTWYQGSGGAISSMAEIASGAGVAAAIAGMSIVDVEPGDATFACAYTSHWQYANTGAIGNGATQVAGGRAEAVRFLYSAGNIGNMQYELYGMRG